MPTLAAFYKKINIAQEGYEVQTNTSVFDYATCLTMLRESLHRNSPGWDFKLCTDDKTEISLPQNEFFRNDISQLSLMESLVNSNTNYVKQNVGQSVLCGADHLIVKPLDPMFQDQFDITLLVNGNNINNTVVIVNTDSKNHNRVVDFFESRQKFYNKLEDNHKQWLGDQISFEYALQHWGFDQPLHTYIGSTVCSQGLTVKFIGYNEKWVYGVKKKSPAFSRQALFVDFKGAKRKQWFGDVYNNVMDSLIEPESQVN